jgi:hypothetical protein
MTPLSDIAEHWSVISALLDEALALPLDARAGWLDTLGGERAVSPGAVQALQALLKTQSEIDTRDFLEHLPSLPVGETTDGAEPRSGELVGPWRLLREIGRGGMGHVWLAERADGVARRSVALKLPRVAWGRDFAERLAREREILAGLEHEHIARLYDAGLDAHGRPWLAMQYVEGEHITVHAQRHALSVAARIGLLLQVMAALAHAHARLVVHRDLKPGNILVSPDGRVTLLDFGLARLLAPGQGEALPPTELAGRALTPDYASPEQIRGAALGTASDVYSLGVVAYELLAGTRPYRLARGSAAELELAILEVQPPRASEAAVPPALKKALRGDLDAILNQALKKDEAARYISVDAFAQDLRRYLEGKPVQARPDSRGYRLARWARRHRLAVGMGSALTLAVLAGSGVSLWQAREARAQAARASTELRRQHAVQDLYIETMSRVSVLSVEQPEQINKPGGVSSVMLEKLREFEKSDVDKPDEFGAQLESAMLQLDADARYEDALAVGRQLLQHLKAHDGAPDDVLNTYATLGRLLSRLRRIDESEAMRREGLAWAPGAHDAESEAIRLTLADDLGDLLINQGQRAEALQVLTRADDAAARYFADDHIRFNTLMSLAFFNLGFDDAQALRMMRQSQAEWQQYPNADGDRSANFAWWMGEALLANGELAQAEAWAMKSLDLYRHDAGRDSLAALRAFGRFAGVVDRADPARAVALIDAERQWLAGRPGGLKPAADRILRARQLDAALLVGDLPAMGTLSEVDAASLLKSTTPAESDLLLSLLARALAQAGRGDEALALARSLHARSAAHGGVTLASVRTELALAEVQLAVHRPAETLQTTTALLAQLDGVQGQRSRSYRQALAMGAQAAALQGDARAATALLQRLAQQPAPPFPSAVERADCDLLQALALQTLGRRPEAAAIARRVLGELKAQHAQSPRLALARALADA